MSHKDVLFTLQNKYSALKIDPTGIYFQLFRRQGLTRTTLVAAKKANTNSADPDHTASSEAV